MASWILRILWIKTVSYSLSNHTAATNLALFRNPVVTDALHFAYFLV